MIENFFTSLSHAIEGSHAVALAAAGLWGICSIILSPCHLASIPLIVGFIGIQGTSSLRRTALLSTLFAAGILISIALIGIVTALAGRMLGDLGPWSNYIVIVLFFAFGLVLLDVIPLSWSAPQQAIKAKGPLAAFLLGSIFGVALGPCSFAFMAPLLGIIFKLGSSQLWYGIGLLTAFGLGHCSAIVAAGTSTDLVQRFLNLKGINLLRQLCGILLLVAGLYLIYTM